MHFKTPSFWYADSSAASIPSLLLTPLSYIYRFGFDVRQRISNPYRSSLPVICVGNLTAGGSGKSPCAIAVKHLLTEKGIAKFPCFLIRGYKGSLKGPVVVDPKIHTAKEVGDEALMLAKHGNVVVSKSRKKGAKLAAEKRFDFIIMDDGLQNPHIEKDCNIVAVNGIKGFGNRKQIPAGPLRQSIKSGLKKADCVVVIGEDEYGLKDILGDAKTFHASFEPAKEQDLDPKMKSVAFAAIAHPDNFKRTLEGMDINIHSFYSYPDHKPLKESDELEILIDAYNSQSQIITTEKDFVKLSKQFQNAPPITYLKMELNLIEADDLAEHIKQTIVSARKAEKKLDTSF